MHDLSAGHRHLVLKSALCGCFHCVHVFTSISIRNWCDEHDGIGHTALCPRCGLDAVIPCGGGLAGIVDLLTRMRRWWFAPPVSYWRQLVTAAGDARDLPKVLKVASEDYRTIILGAGEHSVWENLWVMLGRGEKLYLASLVAAPFIADIACSRAPDSSCVTPLVFVMGIEEVRRRGGSLQSLGEDQARAYLRSLSECADLVEAVLRHGWAGVHEHRLALFRHAVYARGACGRASSSSSSL